MMKAFVLSLLITSSLLAQPELDIRPGNIEFKDYFHRLENVYFINKGDQPLRIDSVPYRNDHYFMRFGYNYQPPFFIQPGDTILMDCILAGYLYVPVSDTADTVFVYSNSVSGVENLKIKVDFFDDDYSESEINGTVTGGSIPVENASVYFFHEGTMLVDSAKTDALGNYSVFLYPGNYLIAAEKSSNYLTFYGDKPDPFSAQRVILPKLQTVTANISLIPADATPFSITGRLMDSLTNQTLKKGLIVVKKGTHTPGKKSNLNFAGDIYSAVSDLNGSYTVNNIISPDYYYIQAFSNYYIPGYYTFSHSPSVFWQNADTLLINSALQNIDLGMIRDSSFGGGIVNGTFSASNKGDLSGAMVYAQPVNSSNFYTFASGTDSGNFKISYLPYGSYNLIGQKAGVENAYAGPVKIDSLNTDTSGINLVFSVLSADDGSPVPGSFILKQNYPNPFNPETNFEIIIPEAGIVELKIYNILGELAAVLYKGYLAKGTYHFRFDSRNFSSGTYLAVLQSGNIFLSKKILLLK